MESALAYGVAALIVLVGLAGTVLPVIPGALLVFCGLFLAAWADDFTRVGAVALSIIGALGLLSFVVDFVGTLLGAKRVGASPHALFGAALGSIVGIAFGLAGLVLGPFIGAVAGELIARGGLSQAGKVGFGTWVGLLAAAIGKVVLAFLMIAAFAAAWVI